MFRENDNYDDYKKRFYIPIFCSSCGVEVTPIDGIRKPHICRLPPTNLQDNDYCSKCGGKYPSPVSCPDCGIDITPVHNCAYPNLSMPVRHHCLAQRDTFPQNDYPSAKWFPEYRYRDRDYDDFGQGNSWNSKPF